MSKDNWRKGPANHIVCEPPHDRPIFSLAVSQNKFVTGSADHGLREYSMYREMQLRENGKHIRQLFSKKYGHKEWVSTCAYTPSGQIISGGMDSMVCFWDSKAVKCDHLAGHQGSISKVMANDRVGISASYDATMIVWDLAKRTESQKLIGPHKEAVMTFQWHQSLLVSADKSGVIGIWDLNEGKLIRAVKTHKGAASRISFQPKLGLIFSAGLNDGSLACLDMRTNQGVYKQMLHKGATTDLKVDGKYVITSSADHTVNVLEIPEFKTVHKTDIKDMGFAIEQAHGTIVVGTSGGNIVATDLLTGKLLYGYGVIKKGECRLLGINKNASRLVCAGQDDSPSLLTF